MLPFFKVTSRSKKSKARLGTITTDHGLVQTPAFVPVGTKGTIKALPQSFFKDIGIQLSFVNTYHLVTHPGVEVIKKAGGIHKLANYHTPLMSDSGGFQVFSLAQNARKAKLQGDDSNVGIIATQHKGEGLPLVVKISDDGVKFRSVYDGQLIEFTPEKSMEYQKIIGADMNMAFDECTYYPATHEYTEKAMGRTHEWLKRCITYKKTNDQYPITNNQRSPNDHLINENSLDIGRINIDHSRFLYGIIQGGTYEDLRVASAKFIQTQDVSGVAIGGVSVGETKEEMRKQVEWIAPYLPPDKPVHLLGVGHVDDIIDLVGQGIDTFDCVEPTRLARMGRIYDLQQILSRILSRQGSARRSSTSTLTGSLTSRHLLQFDFDILNSKNKNNTEPLDAACVCMVCQHYSKAYLHHLFKQREIVGYTLATYHNLWVMEKLMEELRQMIGNDLL